MRRPRGNRRCRDSTRFECGGRPPCSAFDLPSRRAAPGSCSVAMSEPTDAQESFMSHLIELRMRLMRSIIAIVIVVVALFPFAKDIYALLAQPLLRVLPHGSTMIATDVTGTFLVPLKVTLMAAFLIALPYVLWQAWAFVAPGLYQHEKRLVVPVLVSSCLFFVLGMSFAYFFVFPVAFGFFAGYAPVRDRRRVRRRRAVHAAGRRLAVPAGGSLVAALRTGAPARAVRHRACGRRDGRDGTREGEVAR